MLDRKFYFLHFGVWHGKDEKEISVDNMSYDYILNVGKKLNLTIKEWVDLLRLLEYFNYKDIKQLILPLSNMFGDNIAYMDKWDAKANKIDDRKERYFRELDEFYYEEKHYDYGARQDDTNS